MNRRGFFKAIGLGMVGAIAAKLLPQRELPTQAKLGTMLVKMNRDRGHWRVCRANTVTWGGIELTPIRQS